MTRAPLVTGILVALVAQGSAAPPPRQAVAVLPSGAAFQLEIAADPVTRARGYMYRDLVGPAEGMLFLFEDTDRHGIWMKNCRVDLDVIWMDERFRVVHIAHRLQPCAPDRRCPVTVPPAAARYVLEIAGGRAAAEELDRGDRIEILADPPL